MKRWEEENWEEKKTCERKVEIVLKVKKNNFLKKFLKNKPFSYEQDPISVKIKVEYRWFEFIGFLHLDWLH